MFTTSNRGATREVFFRAWRHHRDGQPLEGIERLLVQIALRHPEYHALLEDPDKHLERDFPGFLGNANPFLHMGLHIAIEEQLALDEPRGVRDIYQALLARNPDEHDVQHHIMECLGEWLRQAQQGGAGLDPARYLECLRRLATPAR
jgi:hypothetical protein